MTAPPTRTIEIGEGQLLMVREILARHVPGREVWAFGSRVKGTSKRFSDLDLVILGESPLPIPIHASLADDFLESDLPFKVDLVDWALTSETFRSVIESAYVVVQPCAPVAKQAPAGVIW